MTDFDRRLFEAFQVEYREHLERIRAILAGVDAGLEVGGSDLEESLRRAHNLKGAARAVDLRAVEVLAHRLETVFSRASRGVLVLDRDVAAVIHVALDSIEDWVTTLASGQTPVEPARALEAMDRLLGTTEAPAEAAVEPAAAASAAGAAQPVETLRVTLAGVERLLSSTGQLIAECLRQDLLSREVHSLQASITEVVRDWERVARAAAEAARGSQALERLDIGMRALARQARRVQQVQQEGAWTLRRLGRRLHEDVRRVLMVPARSVFEGFPKLMRDLARDLGRDITFHMQGIDVEADRRVLQALKDPLVHLLRNAASHGIEPPAERILAGKRSGGRVEPSVEARGNRLTIRVEDDGRGLDLERVSEIAVKRGLISEPEAAGTADLSRLLFEPGFSTSQVITEVAGRGFGLSVVHEVVSRLQGDVQIEHAKGAGTAFVLAVPLSLSTQPLLLVSCRGQTLGVPTTAIDRLHRIAARDIQTVEGKPVVAAQDGPVPLWTLAHLIGLEDSPVPLTGDFLSVMILRSGTRRVAAVVDAFIDKVDGVLKDLGAAQPAGLPLGGGIVLGDGSICLVLNPVDLVEATREVPQAPLLVEQPVTAEKAMPCVLVVDDSFTTRTLEKGILESNGYRVRVAVDGVEALHVLRRESIDLIVADIQMPRMDGFALLEALKADARLAPLPVILVTSMESREDQERGLRLGADAYILKRKFDQRDLLNTVKQLL